MGTIERYFEEYVVGEKVRGLSRTIEQSDVNAFAGLTMDMHPAHIDEVFAAHAFGKRLAHGMLTFSLVTGLTCEYNLRAFSYGYDKARFLRPVYAGDTVTGIAEVIALEPRPAKPHGLVRKRYDGLNQAGELVFSCVHVLAVEQKGAAGDA